MNYATITSTALALADRSDSATSALMPQFILIAEANLNRKLLVDGLAKSTTIACTGAYSYSLPTDFSSIRDVAYQNPANDPAEGSLRLSTPSAIDALQAAGNGGPWYSIEQQKIRLAEAYQSPVTLLLTYYADLTPLTAVTSNWLADTHPDIYIRALLVELSMYAKDYNASQVWGARLQDGINELMNQDAMGKWSGGVLQPLPG